MRKIPSRLQSGFTLIELVIVIVIIGILAAVAIPNFADTTDDAKGGVAKGIGGALASWSSTNYARCKGNLGGAVAALATCAALASETYADGGSRLTITGTLTTAGASSACTVTQLDSKALTHTVTFSAYGTPATCG